MKRWAIALGLLLLAGTARAAPPDEHAGAAVTEAAKARFNEGVKLYAKKRYDRALAAFLQAYALTKNPAILFNLGQTSLKLGDPLRALRSFEQFLKDAPNAPPDQRTRAQTGITESRRALGSIEVTAPDGADIAVDGEPVGRAPLAAPIPALPGEHAVTITTASGAKLANVDVKAGMTARLKLAAAGPPPPPGAVSEAPPPTSDETRPERPTAPPRKESPPEEPGFFAPPSTMAPVYVSGVVGVGALSAAIIFHGIGANADRNIAVSSDALARNGKDASACGADTDAATQSACASLARGERIAADTRTPFLGTLVVGLGATAFALGWYFLAPKSAPRMAADGTFRF